MAKIVKTVRVVGDRCSVVIVEQEDGSAELTTICGTAEHAPSVSVATDRAARHVDDPEHPQQQAKGVRYFAHYVADNGRAQGNTEVVMRLPVRGMADVKAMAEAIRRQGVHDPLITNWQRFEQ